MKKALIKKLMIRFLFAKFIPFHTNWKLVSEFTLPPKILVLSQLNPFNDLVSYYLQNDF
jgi:hypothetical protein